MKRHIAILMPLILVMPLFTVTGCANDSEGIASVVNPRRPPSNLSSQASQVSGEINLASSSPAPETALQASTPEATVSATPTPTFFQTPTPKVAITAVTANPISVVLYERSDDPSKASQAQLSASARRADGASARVVWASVSEGMLNVTTEGLVSVPADSTPGLYYVRVHAVDDPSHFAEVAVEVRAVH